MKHNNLNYKIDFLPHIKCPLPPQVYHLLKGELRKSLVFSSSHLKHVRRAMWEFAAAGKINNLKNSLNQFTHF